MPSSDHRSGDQQISPGTGFGDFIQPFQIEDLGLMGRLVRLDSSLESAFKRQNYPDEVAQLLAEAMALTASLSGIIKFDGIFTLQAQGDGPVNLLMSDITSDGDMRGYARFHEDGVAKAIARPGSMVPKLLGKGHLALTVDQGPETERYQGIVELVGASVADCAQAYFSQSEQLETAIIVVSEINEGAQPRSAALMVQRMPGETEDTISRDMEDEAWHRAVVLMSSIKADELLGDELSASQLLYRLYHEDGVRLYPLREVRHTCRCSRQKVSSTLASFPQAEIEEMAEDGVVTVTCEFCKTDYRFGKKDVAELFKQNLGV
ncbi:MAG: Hsp33 family molecular chaperone HslO [Rhodospirillales bacterium]|nr:Hsp33 family molecular chaperone HslO [Rhodospirillales bacterium]